MPFEDQIVVARYRNPAASGDLELIVSLDCNTSSETINANIRANAAREDLEWLAFSPAHDGAAVVVGGGPSAKDHLADIAELKAAGAWVLALNGASGWLRSHGVAADCQCIIDARPENADLVDREAGAHLFASQVDPSLLDVRPTLMHLMTPGVEDCLPPERKALGGYALLGGGYGVGNTAICAAYVMGYRTIHCFGFDSSHRDNRGHAYPQPMNDADPLVETVWNGVRYVSSMAMKAHAERFQVIAGDLELAGCTMHVHGDGLLPAMWRMRGARLSEKSKYHLLWSTAAYREVSPGEQLVSMFVDVAKPQGLVIDFGCGTGRASVELHRRGYRVLLVDFAENCRDPAAMDLPFVEWDLTERFPARAGYGLCTDVLEHIPEPDVERVLDNLIEAAPRLFLSIGVTHDCCGELIGQTLHHTVRPHAWWREKLERRGAIQWEHDGLGQSIFYLVRHDVQ